MYATSNEDQAYIFAMWNNGVNITIFQEHGSFYITFFQHLTEWILQGRNNCNISLQTCFTRRQNTSQVDARDVRGTKIVINDILVTVSLSAKCADSSVHNWGVREVTGSKLGTNKN